MTQRTVLQTTKGSTIALTASLPATYDAAGYAATSMVYSAVGQVEDHGEHGGEASVSKFTAVDDGVVQKFKGSKDYGTMPLMLGCLPSDSGQALIDDAFESQNRYSCKVTYPLGSGEVTPEIHYLDVLVTKRVWQDGTVDNVRKVSTVFEICRAPVVVDAT